MFNQINIITESLIPAITVLGLILIGKLFLDKISKFDSSIEINEKNNLAIAIRNMGFYIGISIAMMSTYKWTWHDQIINGSCTLIFMFIVFNVSRRFILNSNDDKLLENNIGSGIGEAAIYIATGIISYGSFEGDGPIYSSIVFFLLGQLNLILIMRLFNFIHKVNDDNFANLILKAGVIIAYALILKSATEGEFNGWTQDFISYGLSTLNGIIIMLLVANKLIDRVFLYDSSIKQEIIDENPAAMIIVAGIKIAIAIVVSSVII